MMKNILIIVVMQLIFSESIYSQDYIDEVLKELCCDQTILSDSSDKITIRNKGHLDINRKTIHCYKTIYVFNTDEIFLEGIKDYYEIDIKKNTKKTVWLTISHYNSGSLLLFRKVKIKLKSNKVRFLKVKF